MLPGRSLDSLVAHNWKTGIDTRSLSGGDSMRNTIAFAAGLLLASPVAGHHSDAGLDMESVVEFEGTVTEFNWRNPHVYFTVETLGETGESVEWTLQMGSALVLSRRGWTRETLSAGDRITVSVHPAVDGRPYGIPESIEKEGGIGLAMTADLPEVAAGASTLAGIWLADGSELASYPGGFDGFFLAHLVLTERGKAAEAQYDPLSAENPEATCVGRPTPAMIVSSRLYPIEIQIDEAGGTVGSAPSTGTNGALCTWTAGRIRPTMSDLLRAIQPVGGTGIRWWWIPPILRTIARRIRSGFRRGLKSTSWRGTA